MNEQEHCLGCGINIDPIGGLGGFPGLGPCASCLLSTVMDPPEVPDLAGERLGRYVIGRALGKGGMGVVYEAFDTRLRRTVALKILADDLEAPELKHTVALKIRTDDLDAPDQLVNEARLAAALEHEHIVPVYEVGDHHGIAYLAMKRIDGGPLKTPAPDERRAAEIAMEIAKAVAFAHRHGILHRDVKPANVLVEGVDGEGRAFVTDFGLAAREGLAAAPGGTPAYMAPEVWKGEPVSTAADIWSMGATLYELLTGNMPFEAESRDGLMRKVLMEPPPALAGVDLDLAAVCMRCLEKDPTRRYATAGALVADLDRFLHGESVEARPMGAPARLLQSARRNPLLTLGLLGTFIALLIAPAVAFSLAAARKEALIEATQESNAWGAHLVAMNYQAKLERASRMVADDAERPELKALLKEGDDRRAQAWLAQVAQTRPGFTNWMIQNAAGRMIARVPWPTTPPPTYDLHDRDYFRGAAARAGKTGVDAVHISRVYTSTIDDGNKFAISVPIWDGPPDAPRLLGRLGSGLPTASTMGLSGRRTSLAGRVDDDAKERYQLIFHPDYNTPKVAIPVSAHRLFEIQKQDPSKPEIEPFTDGAADDRPAVTDDDYTDPVAAMQGAPARRWLAAFAPVGKTELVAIVQVPFDEAIEPDATRTRWLFICGSAVLALLLSIGWIRAARGRARRRPPATTATRKKVTTARGLL